MSLASLPVVQSTGRTGGRLVFRMPGLVAQSCNSASGGLRPGDMILEINGLPIRHSDDTKVFVQGSNKLRMLIIPGAGHQNVRKLAQKFEVQARDRSTRAEMFFRKVSHDHTFNSPSENIGTTMLNDIQL